MSLLAITTTVIMD